MGWEVAGVDAPWSCEREGLDLSMIDWVVAVGETNIEKIMKE